MTPSKRREEILRIITNDGYAQLLAWLKRHIQVSPLSVVIWKNYSGWLHPSHTQEEQNQFRTNAANHIKTT